MVAIWALLLEMIPINTTSPHASIAALQYTESGAVAAIYHWKGKPVKLKEYNRCVRDIAEPIDRDAEEHGAFISVTT